MQLYFNSMAAGGSGDGDFGNSLNFWQDSGDTVPNGAVPLSTDDVILQDTPLLGSGVCDDLTSSSFSSDTINGASITVYGVVSQLIFNGGTLLGSSGVLQAAAVDFSADPGGPINGVSACSYQSSIAEAITDDGSGDWAGYTFSGVITVTAGTMTVESNATFTDTVTAPAISLPASGYTATFSGGATVAGAITAGAAANGSFSGTCSCTSFAATFTGGTLTCTAFFGVQSGGTVTCTTFTGVQSGGVVTLTGSSVTYTPSSHTAGTVGYSGSISQLTLNDPLGGIVIATNAPTYVAPQYVLTGQSTGGNPGTLTLPAANQVLTSAGAFGVGGTGSTPTATIPAQSDVRNNVQYGVGGTGSTGTLVSSGSGGGRSTFFME